MHLYSRLNFAINRRMTIKLVTMLNCERIRGSDQSVERDHLESSCCNDLAQPVEKSGAFWLLQMQRVLDT